MLLEGRLAGVAVGVELGVTSIEVDGDDGIPWDEKIFRSAVNRTCVTHELEIFHVVLATYGMCPTSVIAPCVGQFGVDLIVELRGHGNLF